MPSFQFLFCFPQQFLRSISSSPQSLSLNRQPYSKREIVMTGFCFVPTLPLTAADGLLYFPSQRPGLIHPLVLLLLVFLALHVPHSFLLRLAPCVSPHSALLNGDPFLSPSSPVLFKPPWPAELAGTHNALSFGRSLSPPSFCLVCFLPFESLKN